MHAFTRFVHQPASARQQQKQKVEKTGGWLVTSGHETAAGRRRQRTHIILPRRLPRGALGLRPRHESVCLGVNASFRRWESVTIAILFPLPVLSLRQRQTHPHRNLNQRHAYVAVQCAECTRACRGIADVPLQRVPHRHPGSRPRCPFGSLCALSDFSCSGSAGSKRRCE